MMTTREPSDALATSLVEFTGSLAAAVTIEELDRCYLDTVRTFVDTSKAGLYLLNPFNHGTERIATVGVSDYFLARYEEAGRPSDPVLAEVLACHRPVLNRQLMSRDEWCSLDVYGEVFHLHRMTVLLEAPVLDGDELVGTLNFGDDDDGGLPSSEEVCLAGALGGLLGIVLRSIREREQLQRERDHVVAALELCDDALVVTDLRHGYRRANAAARRVLARIDGADEEGWLDEVMADQRHEGDVALAKASVPLREGDRAMVRVHSMTLLEEPSLLVSFLSLTGGESHSLPCAVEGVLTVRERQVAEQVVRGLHDAEIADHLMVSPHTVKEYLKAVYRKLGVRSRVDLTALLLQGRARTPPPRTRGSEIPPARGHDGGSAPL